MPRIPLGRARPAAAPIELADVAGRLRRPRAFLFVIMTAQLMVVLDTTIVNVALPSMEHSLRLSGGQLSWVLNAYIITFGGLLLLGARAGDLLGRRRAFLAGIAVFTVSSLAGGLATGGGMLLAARALQGVGAALAAPSALSLLTATFAEGPRRVRAIAMYTTVSAAGAAVGLVAGGLLTDLLSWRAVMFVNVPIGVAVWVVGRAVLQETALRPGRFDVLGALTSTLGTTALVFGLVEAGTTGWTRPLTLAALLIGAVLLATFVVVEGSAAEPILPLRLLTHRARASANGARAVVYGGMFGSFFYLSQFLQDVQHYDALRAGVAFLPWPVAVFAASQFTSRVLVRRFPLRVVMMTGITLVGLGLVAATQLQVGSSYAQILVSLLCIGAGMGISFVSLTTAGLSEVQPADQGAASGLINVSQQLGGAMGLAVLVTGFGVASDHARLGAASSVAATAAHVITGFHDVFALGLALALGGLVLVAVGLRPRRTAPRPALVEAPDAEAAWDEEWEAAEAG